MSVTRASEGLAKRAWEAISHERLQDHKVSTERFSSLVRSLPADLQIAGLVTTVAVLEAHETPDSSYLLSCLAEAVREAPGSPAGFATSGPMRTNSLIGMDETERRLVQRIVLEYAVWLKRACDAVLGTASGRGGRSGEVPAP